MTTAEEARRKTLNAIKETYEDQLALIDVIIDRACDVFKYEDTVTFESSEDRDNVRLYLDELGYETWCGVKSIVLLSHGDIKKVMKNSYGKDLFV